MTTKESNQIISDAITSGTAKVLTLELAKQLKGKRIITKYFGYRGQNGVENFVVGEIKENDDVLELLDSNGDCWSIRCHFKKDYIFSEPTFTSSDEDREVHFVEIPLNEVELNRVFHKKNDGKLLDFLTNLSLEEVTKQNAFLREKGRVIVKTKKEFVNIENIDNCNNSYVNGILTPEWLDTKPDNYTDQRLWNEFYQRTTGNTLPKGGVPISI